jgi:hypothetical protein
VSAIEVLKKPFEAELSMIPLLFYLKERGFHPAESERFMEVLISNWIEIKAGN